MVKKPFVRLGQNVLPTHYKIFVKIDIAKCEFNGHVEADITVNEPCTSILLYSVNLEVTQVKLLAGDETIAAKEILELKDDERVEFVMEKTVPKGSSTLVYSFSGKINDNLRGLYLCRSKNDKGEQINSVCTMFAPTDCRRAFPCWDEPAIKATFELVLITKKDFVTLANTLPVEEKPLPEGWVETRFQRTPKMSSYLLCFIVGQYNYVEVMTSRSIRVRVYTPVGKTEQAKFALDIAVRSLDFFEDYFEMPYPLSKADLIAVPDFAFGAMENWGLITFRETRILIDPAHSTTAAKQSVAECIAHELSHQWFGNLVTMEWWTWLWLNEGFAKFMENLAVSILEPTFDSWTQFPCDVLNSALALDALESSHPIEVDVNHPAEVEEIFDNISYEKGAAVIAMLHHYIGKEHFRAGLRLYMKRHAYGNTKTQDLWAAISEASSQSIDRVMDTWVKQMGFPVITVTSRVVGTSRVLVLKQGKFYSLKDKAPAKGPQPQWKVPLVIGVAGQKPQTALLDSTEKEIELKDVDAAAWISVNYGAFGVYRVHYNETMLEAMLPAIQNRSLPTVDRYMVHSDLFALVMAGYASTKQLLKLTGAYKSETELSVWKSILALIASLDLLLDEEPALHEKFCTFARQLFSEIFDKLGWDPKPDDTPSAAMLRTLILNAMVCFEDAKVLEEARRRFRSYVDGKGMIAADARKAVYRAVAMDAHRNPSSWDDLLRLHRSADLQEESHRIASSLGYAKSKDLLLKVLEFADSDAVRSQDIPFVIAPVARSPLGRDLAWTHFTTNFEKYKTKYNCGILFHRFISIVGGSFHSLDKAKEFAAFFQQNPVEGGERVVRQTIETIETNAKWQERDGQQIAEFLKDGQW